METTGLALRKIAIDPSSPTSINFGSFSESTAVLPQGAFPANSEVVAALFKQPLYANATTGNQILATSSLRLTVVSDGQVVKVEGLGEEVQFSLEPISGNATAKSLL